MPRTSTTAVGAGQLSGPSADSRAADLVDLADVGSLARDHALHQLEEHHSLRLVHGHEMGGPRLHADQEEARVNVGPFSVMAFTPGIGHVSLSDISKWRAGAYGDHRIRGV
jgi:hypothetical protein